MQLHKPYRCMAAFPNNVNKDTAKESVFTALKSIGMDTVSVSEDVFVIDGLYRIYLDFPAANAGSPADVRDINELSDIIVHGYIVKTLREAFDAMGCPYAVFDETCLDPEITTVGCAKNMIGHETLLETIYFLHSFKNKESVDSDLRKHLLCACTILEQAFCEPDIPENWLPFTNEMPESTIKAYLQRTGGKYLEASIEVPLSDFIGKSDDEAKEMLRSRLVGNRKLENITYRVVGVSPVKENTLCVLIRGTTPA